MLATQRPSGSVNDNIKANTNLRISLRMLDGGESSAVIGVPDAAAIPAPLKGRGFAKMGPGELVAFQSAWSGAPLLAESGTPPVVVKPFGAAAEQTMAAAGIVAAMHQSAGSGDAPVMNVVGRRGLRFCRRSFPLRPSVLSIGVTHRSNLAPELLSA
jgi:S-DNA-T family DNA segregation ATPase FtsK/SpoIIIE